MSNDATVHAFGCGVARGLSGGAVYPSQATTCTRQRHHAGDHRGPEAGTGRLVSWGEMPDDVRARLEHPAYGDRLDETAELWSTDPDGWSSAAGGTLEPYRHPRDPLDGFWHAVAVSAPVLVYGLVLVLALIGPALVVAAWRLAVT